MTKTEFNNLPIEVQEKAKNHLRAFSECHIEYEYGEYKVGGGICLRKKYADDFKSFGQILAEDIYTRTERIENYINGFCDYPMEYKGKRDYINVVKKMSDEKEFDFKNKTMFQWVGKINEKGDFEITHKQKFNI